MKALLCAIILLVIGNYCFAQHVYQIRADTVRIYNTCDTAELVLENRTQDTLGFLFNKGRGRTEFRRLHLASPGPGLLSILGQDTVDLGFTGLGDGRYDLLNTNFVTVPIGTSWLWNQWPVNKVVGYEAYNSPDMPHLSSQAYQGMGQTSYYNGLVLRDGNSGFDLAVNWDGELNGPNGAFLRVKDDTKLAWSNWRELIFKDYGDTAYALTRNLKTSGQAQVHWGNIINAPSAFPTNETLQSVINRDSTTSKGILFTGTAAHSPGLNWTYNTDSWRIFVESPQDTPGGDQIFEASDNDQEGWVFRTKGLSSPMKNILNIQPEGIFTFKDSSIWHAGNHPAGLPFTATTTGANIISSVTTNSAGHVTAIATRALTAADLGAASATSSGSYIWNQNPLSAAQTGNLWVSGEVRAGTVVTTPTVYSRNSNDALVLIGGATDAGSSRGGQITLYAGANPSSTSRGIISFGTGTGGGGTAQPERMRIDAAGNVGIGTAAPTSRLHVVNTANVSPGTATSYVARFAQNVAEVAIGGDTSFAYIQSFNTRPLKLNNQGNAVLFPGAVNAAAGVGIGTVISPQASLHLATSTAAGGIIMQFTGAYSATSGLFLRFHSNGTPTAVDQRLGGMLWGSINGTTTRTGAQIEALSEAAWTDGTSHPSYLRFMTTPAGAVSVTEKMRITAAGNVGIGTNAPGAMLHVNGTARVVGVADLGDNSFIRGSGAAGIATMSGLRFMENNGTTRRGYVGDGSPSNSDIYLISDSGGVRLLPVTVSGVNGSLFVQGNLLTYNGGRITLNNGTSNMLDFSATGAAAPTFTTRSAGTKLLLWQALSTTQADFAIGTESGYIWNSVPTSTYGFKWYAGTTQVARLDGLGNLTLNGQVQATSYYQTSLRSLKKDIQPFKESALEILAKAQVRTFKFKADPEAKTNIGFIADEVPDQMAAPKRSGVDQASTVALLVKAVQELTTQNKALQQELEAVKQQLKEKATRLP